MALTESSQSVQQRQLMVEEQLRRREITDQDILAIMGQLPRHCFIPPENRLSAYSDCPVPIGYGQTISQPYIVALMTQHLQLRQNHRVLEIGTGCGYQTAILARLAREVCTIERIEQLAIAAKESLSQLGIDNIKYHIGDGAQGWPRNVSSSAEEAAGMSKPLFDRILITAGAESLPPAVWDQLADGGKMVAPIGPMPNQRLLLLEKEDQQKKETLLCHCRFVKLVTQ